MKIGVSSQNFRTITGHAGKARRFFVYEGNSAEDLQLSDKLDLPKSQSIHESNPAESHVLDELDILITAGCGDGFIRKMANRGIKVITTAEQDPLIAAKKIIDGKPLARVENK
jgi:predicted Fe-Mo cluster-binding NifX family protein